MVYYVYLIKTLDGFLKKSYVGYTNNLFNRVAKHNNNQGAKSTKGYKWEIVFKKRLDKHNSNKGAKSTRGYIWHLVYIKKFYSKNRALSYEYALKKNRTKRKDLIDKFNDTHKK